MQIAEEPLTKTLQGEILPMLDAHRGEVCQFEDLEIDVDWELYEFLEERGHLKVFTVRDFGTLVGYLVYTINPCMHYKSQTQAQQAAIYIHPDFRKGSLGQAFIQYADIILEDIGVTMVYQTVRAAHDFSPVLESLGYVFEEKVYIKRL